MKMHTLAICTITLSTLSLLGGCAGDDGGGGEEEYRQGLVVHSDIQYRDDVGGFAVLATGTVSGGGCSVSTPALVAIDPALITSSIP